MSSVLWHSNIFQVWKQTRAPKEELSSYDNISSYFFQFSSPGNSFFSTLSLFPVFVLMAHHYWSSSSSPFLCLSRSTCHIWMSVRMKKEADTEIWNRIQADASLLFLLFHICLPHPFRLFLPYFRIKIFMNWNQPEGVLSLSLSTEG